MGKETSKYTDKTIITTPFGINVETFKPQPKEENDEIVIGTIKALEKWYGIDYLMKAFAIVKHKYPEKNLKLLIVGGGSLLDEYKNLAKELIIDSVTEFTGFIPFSQITEYHQKLDIYVAVSIFNDESFGVAILEASACAKPVIVSRMGGLPEVVVNNKTGFVVPEKDEYSTAEAIEKLVLDKELRVAIGENGRNHVLDKYNFDDNVNDMINIYKKILKL